MSTTVLCDRHHAGLFHSMQLLAQRFGWTLYTPTGHDWWDEGYWSFGRWTYPDDRLAQQFLHAEGADNEFPDWPINYVTLAQAREMRWDSVIATLQDNQAGFHRLAQEADARYVVQVGNTGQYIDWGLDPLVLNSSEMPILGRGVYYHQPMDPIAFAEPQTSTGYARSAASFANCMTSMGSCYDLLREAQQRLPVAVHGIDGPDGIIKPYTRSLEVMASVGWGWHDKAHGDGFGHVIHTWAAVGRPLIGHASHYRGKMAEPLWIDGETCIDLDRHSVAEAVDTVLSVSPARHREMCAAIRSRFDAIDWDGEAEAIADLLRVAVPA